MKKLLMVLSLAVAAVPAMAAEGGKAAMKTENKAAAKSAPMLEQGAMARTASRAHVDARECLKLATNREIHGCAEKFR
ncbi:MAG: hypothetical protein ACO3IW_08930 [Burkholderiales bacterium]